MSVVFFGSSSFSVQPLQSISSLVTCVVTRKAKPKGRGYLIEDTEVKREASDLRLPVIEIDSFKDEAVVELASIRPEFFVVASFGLIIPKWVLDIPSVGPVNIHPSLLPKYRGPSPIQWALWNGDTETGITFIRMNEKMDAGNILFQETMPIEPDDNVIALSERLSKRSAEILPDFLHKAGANGLQEGLVQNNSLATFTPIITKEMGRIDWSKGAEEVLRQIRALVVWPTAYTFLDGLSLKIFAGAFKESDEGGSIPPGTIVDVTKDGIQVVTGSGILVIKELQLQNRKRMKAYDFSQGYRGLSGKVLKED
jgi:methionyl-tRNA formyltransferase